LGNTFEAFPKDRSPRIEGCYGTSPVEVPAKYEDDQIGLGQYTEGFPFSGDIEV